MPKRRAELAEIGRKKEAEKAANPSAPKKWPRRNKPKPGATADLAALDLSPIKHRGDEAGLTETAARFLALYLQDRLAGRTTSRAALYRALTGCSVDSAQGGQWKVWRDIVSHRLIPEILAGAGITEEEILEGYKESLLGREVARRTAEDGTRDYEVTINPQTRLQAAKLGLEMLGLYTEKLDITLKEKTFAELIREASIEARAIEEAEFTESENRTTENE